MSGRIGTSNELYDEAERPAHPRDVRRRDRIVRELVREGCRHWRDLSRELFLAEALGHQLLHDHRHGERARLILVDFAHQTENSGGRFE